MHETDPKQTGPSKVTSETDPEFTAALDCFGDAVELIGANLNKRDNHDGDNKLKSLAKSMRIGSPDSLYHYKLLQESKESRRRAGFTLARHII